MENDIFVSFLEGKGRAVELTCARPGPSLQREHTAAEMYLGGKVGGGQRDWDPQGGLLGLREGLLARASLFLCVSHGRH